MYLPIPLQYSVMHSEIHIKMTQSKKRYSLVANNISNNLGERARTFCYLNLPSQSIYIYILNAINQRTRVGNCNNMFEIE